MSQILPKPTGLFGSLGVAHRLSLLQAAAFAGIAVYLAFFPPWLASRGLSESQIGFALALAMIVRMVASPLVAPMGDGRIGAVRLLVLLNGLVAAAYLAMHWLPPVWPLIAALAMASALGAAVIPLSDHLTLAHVSAGRGLDYGRIRVWGSVSFLVVTLVSGYLFAWAGLSALPFAMAALAFTCALAAVSAPEDPRRHQTAPVGEEPGDAPRRMRLLWIAVVASALINAGHAPLYAFASIHWKSLGYGAAAIGQMWAFAVLAEIVLLWMAAGKAGKTPQAGLAWLAVAAVASLGRFALMPFAESQAAILALQSTHALSFGAQLMGVMIVMGALAPPGRRARSQGRLAAINALFMAGGTYASGFIYASHGAWVFVAMAPLALVALVLLGVAARMASRLPLDSASDAALPVSAGGDGPERP